MIRNPFPGPQPYRASDRSRFYGRQELSSNIAAGLLANRCTTVYGPSGAGKSSLVQASVIPALIESHEIRVVRVDGWPEQEDPTAWLGSTMLSALGLTEQPGETAAAETILAAAQRAARRSSRIVLVYLDQIEQLLYSSRDTSPIEAFFDCIHQLADSPLRNLRILLSLREDYLGRFRDRLGERPRLLSHSIRVGPLTVLELTDAVCQAAAAGEPPQAWSREQMRDLMLQVRVPGEAPTDDAEAQAAYAQIVCRALFQQRDQGGITEGNIEAEPILHSYLDVTLENLGPLRPTAEELLENHLITADGSRTVRTEKELVKLLPSEHLPEILASLEGAAVLHAEEHQGTRYFEIGHDWLAKKVLDERLEKERAVEQRRHEREQREQMERQQAEAEARVQNEHRRRRRAARIALGAIALMLGAIVLASFAYRDKQAALAARADAERSRELAAEREIQANDAGILASCGELLLRGRFPQAIKLLLEVKQPANNHGWIEMANVLLRHNALNVTLLGHQGSLTGAVYSPDGKSILTASTDETARVYRADGTGQPIVLAGHEGAVVFAVFSPDGKRIVTASEDGTARVWNADGTGQPVVLKGHKKLLVSAMFSPDGRRVVTASEDATARIWNADGTGEPIVLAGHEGIVRFAVFHPDGVRVFTASEDKTVRLWKGTDDGQHLILRGHTDGVVFLAISPDAKHIVSTAYDDTARIWNIEGLGPSVVLRGHPDDVYHAAWSPDSRLVATASADGTARVWSADGTKPPLVLGGHRGTVGFVAFSPNGEHIATASAEGIARLWDADGLNPPVALRGHQSVVHTVMWSPDGSRVVTSAGVRGAGSSGGDAKIWRTGRLKEIHREHDMPGYFHSASFSADGRVIAAAFDDNTARVWQADGSTAPIVLAGHDQWVANAWISGDGKRVVTASFDKTARVWSFSADGQAESIVLRGHEGPLRYAVFSPDGRRVLTTSEDKTARIWNADGSGTPIVLKGHEDWVSSGAWSPDGARVITTSWDGTARLYNADGSGLVVLSGHRGEVDAASFSPDGNRVATVSADHTARIWKMDGTVERVLHGHKDTVAHVVWHPDGKRLLTSSFDETMRIWDVNTETQCVVLNPPEVIISMVFANNGQELASLTANSDVSRWIIDVEEIRQRLAHAHDDCLPVTARVAYLHESKQVAHAKHAECERSYQRNPDLSEEP